MQDRSIDGALLALRKNIIRGGLEGLPHVEALLGLRGVPMPRVMPVKLPDAARRGLMRLIVMDALRGGPMTLADLSRHVVTKRPELTYKAAYQRTSQVLTKLKLDGIVGRDGRMWGLAQ